MGIFTWLQNFVRDITPHLNQLVIFFLILFLGFLIGKIVGRFSRKILTDLGVDGLVRKTLGAKFSTVKLLSGLVTGVIYFVSVILALDSVGVTTMVLQVILLIFVLVIVLSALVALKDVIPNAIAGGTIKQKFTVGSKLSLDHIEGKVTEIKLLETYITTKQGDTVVVPNRLFTEQIVKVRK